MLAQSDINSGWRNYSEEEELFFSLVNNNTDLGGMRFNGPITLFDEIASKRVIDLRDVTFAKPFCLLPGSIIEGQILMDRTEFQGGFKAVEVAFHGGLSAVGARFNRGTSFKRARLMGGCDFSHANIESSDRPFEEAEFYGASPTGLSWIQLASAVVYRRRSCS
jgi:hypothetical protein